MPANSVIQLRRGTAAQWTSANPVLANGEPGYETDTGKEKRGDGSTAWSSLAYFTPGSGTYVSVSPPAGDARATIRAAVLSVASGGRVVLKPGSWQINSADGQAPLDSQSHRRALLYFTGLTNVTIEAEPGAVITTSYANPATMLEIRDSSNVTVRNLTAVWNDLTNITTDNNANISGSLIRYTNVQAGKVVGNDLSHCGYSVVYITGGTSYVEVDGNRVHDCTVGSPSGNGINEDTLNGTAGSGSATVQRGNIISNNQIWNVNGSGSICLDNAYLDTGTRVINNTIDTNRYYQAIRLLNVQGCTISGNTIYDCVLDGIYWELSGGSVDLKGVTISGNTIVGRATRTIGHGIKINVSLGGVGLRDLLISDNVIHDMGRHGVWITSHDAGQVRDALVADNIIEHCDTESPGSYDGINFLASDITLIGNRVNGRTTSHRYSVNVDPACGNVTWIGSAAGSLSGDYHDVSQLTKLYVDTASGAFFSLGGVGTKVKAGALTDGDFSFTVNGLLGLDSNANRLNARIGGVWKTVGFDQELLGAVRSGNYVVPPASAISTVTVTNNTMRYSAVTLTRTITAIRIGLEITTAGNAGALIRLGIYSGDGNYFPSALLLDAGTIDASSTGYKEITISQALPAGRYFLVAAAQSAATTAPVVRGLGSVCPGIVAVSAPVTANLAGYLDSQTVSGALPSTSSVTSNVGGTLVHLKAA